MTSRILTNLARSVDGASVLRVGDNGSMETSRTLVGEGIAKRGNGTNLNVDYSVVVRYTGKPAKITKIEAAITSPPDAIRALAGASATLVLKDGQELDGLCNRDGRFSIANYGNAIRGNLI